METEFVNINGINYRIAYFQANPDKIEELNKEAQIALKKIIGVKDNKKSSTKESN